VLLTGATGRLGACLAEALARDGWHLCLAHRAHPDRALALRTRLDALGAHYTLHAADLSALPDALALAATARALGPVDALLHAAGDLVRGPLLTQSPAELRTAFAVGPEAFHGLAQALVPGMIDRGWGRVVVFGHATVSRLSAPPAIAGYYAAKAALVALARAYARETAGRGVTVNIVSPGVLGTAGLDPATTASLLRGVPGGAAGPPEAIVSSVLHLLSEGAAYVTGAELTVAGGWGL